jgi:amino acid permease
MHPLSPEKNPDLDLEKPATFLDPKVIDESLGESPSCNEQNGQMQRRLKARHVSMIAIGGSFVLITVDEI